MPSSVRRRNPVSLADGQPTTDLSGLRPPGLGSGPVGPRPRACWPEALTARTGYAAAGYRCPLMGRCCEPLGEQLEFGEAR